MKVLARLETPLAGLLYAAATGALHHVGELKWSNQAAVTVVIASQNYPEQPVLGDEIQGIPAANQIPGVQVLHAGTAQATNQIVSAGGRVLSITALGRDLAEARERAYQAVAKIQLRGSHNRTDIAETAAKMAQ